MIKVYYIAGSIALDRREASDVARQILKYALRKEYGIKDAVMLRENGGKPYLRDHRDVHFSITHTKTCIACAVGDVPVGLDAETVNDVDRSRVARRMFNANEQEFVFDGKDFAIAERFFSVWVRKESFVKMNGEGLSRKFVDFDVITGENTGGAVFVPFEVRDAAACVCYRGDNAVSICEISMKDLRGIKL